jgi:hypothetical protein
VVLPFFFGARDMSCPGLPSKPSARWLFWRRGALVALLLLAISLGAALCFTPKVQRKAAGAFGGLAEKVKNRPTRAAAVCLGGLVLLWGGVGVLAAGQAVNERLRGKRRDA